MGRARWIAGTAVLLSVGAARGLAMTPPVCAPGGRTFARSPAIVYGTAWKKGKTEELVFEAVQAGFRGIDTACQPKHYFEAGTGAAIARLAKAGVAREDLFLQTKYTPFRGQVKKISFVGGRGVRRGCFDDGIHVVLQVAQTRSCRAAVRAWVGRGALEEGVDWSQPLKEFDASEGPPGCLQQQRTA